MAKATPKITLNIVKYTPPGETIDQVNESKRDPMPRFRVRGKYGTRAFDCYIDMEIDGRDIEYEQIHGLNMSCEENQDRWDALITVLDSYPGFMDEWNKLTASYYEGEEATYHTPALT